MLLVTRSVDGLQPDGQSGHASMNAVSAHRTLDSYVSARVCVSAVKSAAPFKIQNNQVLQVLISKPLSVVRRLFEEWFETYAYDCELISTPRYGDRTTNFEAHKTEKENLSP